jgi:hypothetical protein
MDKEGAIMAIPTNIKLYYLAKLSNEQELNFKKQGIWQFP